MEPFKNVFSAEVVGLIGDHILKAHPRFERADFIQGVLQDLDALELKARVELIEAQLDERLPVADKERAKILRKVLHPEPWETSDMASDIRGLRGFAVWPLTLIAGRHGLSDLETCLNLLKEMTPRFSSEFGIRYPLLQDQDYVLKRLGTWVDDPCHHVRRLVSEGTRPRLPWAQQLPALIADPRPVLDLLERLRDDPSDYVRRSVANHLNDISKDHPDLIADLVQDWMMTADANRRKLLKHGCRTLIKAGDPRVLEAFGYTLPEVDVEGLRVEPTVIRIGDRTTISARLASRTGTHQRLIVDFVVHFVKANGKLSPKVFKGKVCELPGKGVVEFQRVLSFLPVTTRRYYPGTHKVGLRINGADIGEVSFELWQAAGGF